VKLPQSFIDDVLAGTDIIDIIGQRISLKKTSKNEHKALCPFHEEKTPSFSVNQNKQVYHCFGCRAQGNLISFLMSFDKMTFLEAVETLANHAGLPLPINTDHRQQKLSQAAYLLLENSAKFYQAQLRQSKIAQTYLQSRHLNPLMIEKFLIGFAPPGWDSLIKSLGQNPESLQQLLETGMLAQKNQNNYYDRFRNRITFPIRNIRGQIIAFGGRSLGQDTPKYLNSPETPWFHKSQELYGLYETLQANKSIKQILVVEGYMDVLALHQYGIHYAVATLGTATNASHLHRLLRYTSEITFCFDGDRAGKMAAWKALEMTLPLMRDGVKVNFMFLPSGEDPDTFIRRIGAHKFEAQIKQALSLADFFFQRLKVNINLVNIADKAKFARLSQGYLQRMPKGIFQQLMYERLANALEIPLDKLMELQSPLPPLKPVVSTHPSPNSLHPTIRLATALLLQDPQLLQKVTIPPILDTLKMAGIGILQQLIAILRDKPNKITGSLLEYWREDHENGQIIAELAAVELMVPNNCWGNELQSAFDRILQLNREQIIQQLLAKGSKEGFSITEKQQLQELMAQRPA
jgi:DNA primase